MKLWRGFYFFLLLLCSFVFLCCQRSKVPKYVLEKAKKISFPQTPVCPNNSNVESRNKDKEKIYASILLMKSALDIMDSLSFTNIIYLGQANRCDKGKISERKIEDKKGNKDFTERRFKNCSSANNLVDGKIYVSNDLMIFSDFWTIQKSEFIGRYVFVKDGKIRVLPNNYSLGYLVKDLFLYLFTDLSSVVNEKVIYLDGAVSIQIPFLIRFKGQYREYLINDELYYLLQFEDLKIKMNMGAEDISVEFDTKFHLTSDYVCGNFEIKSGGVNVSHLAFLSNDTCGYRGEIKVNDQIINFSDNKISIGNTNILCFEVFD